MMIQLMTTTSSLSPSRATSFLFSIFLLVPPQKYNPGLSSITILMFCSEFFGWPQWCRLSIVQPRIKIWRRRPWSWRCVPRIVFYPNLIIQDTGSYILHCLRSTLIGTQTVHEIYRTQQYPWFLKALEAQTFNVYDYSVGKCEYSHSNCDLFF